MSDELNVTPTPPIAARLAKGEEVDVPAWELVSLVDHFTISAKFPPDGKWLVITSAGESPNNLIVVVGESSDTEIARGTAFRLDTTVTIRAGT